MNDQSSTVTPADGSKSIANPFYSAWSGGLNAGNSPQRGAIVHTIDASAKYSQHAVGIVRGFRQGLYQRNIDFYVGDVSDWITAQMAKRGDGPFLSHIILDLASSYSHVQKAASALRVDGTLILFNPSITQINDAIKLIRQKRLCLQLEGVTELGSSMTGGRAWDVRWTKLRASQKVAFEDQESCTTDCGLDLNLESREVDQEAFGIQGNASRWELVCRPKVGDRISGGGFIGVWKKNRTRSE